MTPGPRINQIRVGSLQVADAAFPARLLLDWHTHDTPIVAVFLHGSMDVQFRRRRFDCRRTVVQVHPAGERHRQRYGRAGAKILVLEPDPDEVWAEALGGFLSSVHHFTDARILGLAHQAQAELARPDDVAPLAVQGIAYEILIAAARRAQATGAIPRGSPAPRNSCTPGFVNDSASPRSRLPSVCTRVISPARFGCITASPSDRTFGGCGWIGLRRG